MYAVNATRSSYVNGWATDDSKIITPETYAKDHGAILSYTRDWTIASFLCYEDRREEVTENIKLFKQFLIDRNYGFDVDWEKYKVCFAAPKVRGEIDRIRKGN